MGRGDTGLRRPHGGNRRHGPQRRKTPRKPTALVNTKRSDSGLHHGLQRLDGLGPHGKRRPPPVAPMRPPTNGLRWPHRARGTARAPPTPCSPASLCFTVAAIVVRAGPLRLTQRHGLALEHQVGEHWSCDCHEEVRDATSEGRKLDAFLPVLFAEVGPPPPRRGGNRAAHGGGPWRSPLWESTERCQVLCVALGGEPTMPCQCAFLQTLLTTQHGCAPYGSPGRSRDAGRSRRHVERLGPSSAAAVGRPRHVLRRARAGP